MTEDFKILTAGNTLKCILSQSKGCDRKILSAGGLILQFYPWASKISCGLCSCFSDLFVSLESGQ